MFIFSDELQFFPNLNFGGLAEDKEKFWLDCLKQNGVDLSFLNSLKIDSFNDFRTIDNNSDNNISGVLLKDYKKRICELLFLTCCL